MVWGIFEVFLSWNNILYKERPADNRKAANMIGEWKMREGYRTSPVSPPTPQFPHRAPHTPLRKLESWGTQFENQLSRSCPCNHQVNIHNVDYSKSPWHILLKTLKIRRGNLSFSTIFYSIVMKKIMLQWHS